MKRKSLRVGKYGSDPKSGKKDSRYQLTLLERYGRSSSSYKHRGSL